MFLFSCIVVGYSVITGVVIPKITLWYSIPLLLGAAVLNARKAWAIIERKITNACDTVGDLYTCKAWATIERKNTNACDAVGDFYARKACAITERINLMEFCF